MVLPNVHSTHQARVRLADDGTPDPGNSTGSTIRQGALRPASAGKQVHRSPSPGSRPQSAPSTSSVGRKFRVPRSTPQFLVDASEQDSVLPRPLPPGISYVAQYTGYDELVDKRILVQDEDEKVHLSVDEVRALYYAKCTDQQLHPNRQREGRFLQLVSQSCSGIQFTLRENGLGAHSADCLKRILEYNTHYAVVDLSGNRLRDAGALHVAELLKVNDNIVHLALKSNDIGFVGAEALASALMENRTLTSLDLSGLSGINRNHLGTNGAKAVGEAMGVNQTLVILNIGANGIGNDGLGLMAQGLEHNSTLTEIDLGSNNLGWEGCTVLGPLLNVCNIKVLVLERNDIRDKGATILAQALKPPNCAGDKLESLNLAHNHIKSLGFKWIADMLRFVPQLTSLRLDGNDCTQATAELAKALRENKSLKHLMINKCEIMEDGEALGEALARQNHLTRLDLLDNQIGDSGAKAFATALKTNTALRHLELGNNKIGDEGGDALAEMLGVNCSLQHLSLRQNRLKTSGESIAESLHRNTSLLELDFAYNDFSFKSYSSVAACLQKNMKLWRQQAAPRLLTQIDLLKVDEATLHGTEEEILQEIKRRESAQDILVQKRDHIKKTIMNLQANTRRLEEECNATSMKRAKEEEAMAARGDELQKEKAKLDNLKRKLEAKLRSEEERIARIRRDIGRLEQDIKGFKAQDEVELRPVMLELAEAERGHDAAEKETRRLGEELTKGELRVKELERTLGISRNTLSATTKDDKAGSTLKKSLSKMSSTKGATAKAASRKKK